MSYCYFKILQTMKHSNPKIRSTYAIQMSTVSKPNHEECSGYGSGEIPGIFRNLRRKSDHAAAATTNVNLESITDKQPYGDCSKKWIRGTPGISLNLQRNHGHAATTSVNMESINGEQYYTMMNILEMNQGKPRTFPKSAT